MKSALAYAACFAAACFAAACTSTVQLIAPVDDVPSSASPRDVVPLDTPDIATADSVDVATPSDVPRGAQRCAGALCAAGEVCCLTSGTCYDPVRAPERCPRPTTSPDGDPSGSDLWCASDAHCGTGGFCTGAHCLGPGRCAQWSDCEGSDERARCGCDGRTFLGYEDACRARVRLALVAGPLACGVNFVDPVDAGPPSGVNCGVDTQCPSGSRCCFLIGYCVPDDCPACCTAPPRGATRPCRSDADCDRDRFCDGDGCGTPGWCRSRASPDRCNGELDPVCGCNGRSYQNAGCAAVAGTRVARRGTCS